MDNYKKLLYILQVIDSCKTTDQLILCKDWAKKVLAIDFYVDVLEEINDKRKVLNS